MSSNRWCFCPVVLGAFLSLLSCKAPRESSLPPEYGTALGGRETAEFRGVLYRPSEPVEAGSPERIGLKLSRLAPRSVEFSLQQPDDAPRIDDVDRIPIRGSLPYVVAAGSGAGDHPVTLFELREVLVTRIADLKTPSISKLAGADAGGARDPAQPPSFDHAIVELEIRDFDLYAPPWIQIYDHDTGQLIHEVKFRSPVTTGGRPVVRSPQPLPVPIVLAYDTDPWSNPQRKPTSRRSRIELRFLDKVVDTVYARLAPEIWVLPVVWHNVRERGSKFLVDGEDVKQIFWTPDEKPMAANVNSIFRKVQVQFRLIEIRDHLLEAGKSASERCNPQWGSPLSSPEGVDIYAVESIYEQSDPAKPKFAIHGGFGCFGHGFILICEDDFSRMALDGQTRSVAHELGHYVGAPIELHDPTNLMYHPDGTGEVLTEKQKEEIHKRMQELGYQEKL